MSDLKFTRTHEWIKVENDEVMVGITDHAQQLLGDMVFIELPDVGKTFSAGDELGVVESVKAASDFYAPISGEVVAINQQARDNPAIVNTDPYDTGWLVKLKISNKAEINELLSQDQYEREIAEEN